MSLGLASLETPHQGACPASLWVSLLLTGCQNTRWLLCHHLLEAPSGSLSPRVEARGTSRLAYLRTLSITACSSYSPVFPLATPAFPAVACSVYLTLCGPPVGFCLAIREVCHSSTLSTHHRAWYRGLAQASFTDQISFEHVLGAGCWGHNICPQGVANTGIRQSIASGMCVMKQPLLKG